MLKDIWFMFYNQYREYLKASSPPPPVFLERRATPGYPGKGSFCTKGQIERRGRKTCRINNDLLIPKPLATVISSKV